MDRYQHNRPIIKKDNKRIQGQTLYPPIIPKSTDLYIVSRDGQRLDTLAQANNITGGTLFVPPGTQLRIPKDVTSINTDLQKLNTER